MRTQFSGIVIDEPLFPWRTYLADSYTAGWWKFDEVAEGVDYEDSSGNGFDLTNVLSQEGVEGVFGTAIFLDGNNDNAYCSFTAPLTITTNLTVEGAAVRQDTGDGTLVSYWNNLGGPSGPGPWVGWVFGIYGGLVHFILRTTDNPGYTGLGASFSAADMPVGDWCLLRATYDGANIRMYLMNLSAGETEYTLKATQPCTGDIIYDLGTYDILGFGALGYDANPTYGQAHFKGQIDQWAISSTVRNSPHGFEDILPTAPATVNIGSRFREFDNIHCKTVVAERLFGDVVEFVPENTCFVSPTYTDSDESRRYSTVKAALDYAASQVPTATTPWLIHIHAGLYQEERGTWIDGDTEASLVVPDYCYLVGEDRDAVIIEPDSNVSGEPMALFAAILEKDASTTASSHIGFANLTIRNCQYGDGVQVDSFIKKPDYPEFRCHLDNVRLEGCNVGAKAEERNSRIFCQDLFIVNCDIGLQADDAKIFGANVIIRQSGAGKLGQGLYCQDKKGKIQIFGLDIGIDWDGIDRAYDEGVYVTDSAEVHVYNCRIDNADTSVSVTDSGEFKGWGVKLHDCYDYNISLVDDESKAEIFNGELDGPVRATHESDLHLRDLTLDASGHDANAIQWDSTGKLQIGNAIIVSAGDKGTVYRCLDMTLVPAVFEITGGAVRYDHANAKPDYLIRSVVTISGADIRGCGMESGMNGNIRTNQATKFVQGAADYYSTIQDAITSAVSGELVRVNPGTYTEQITMKAGVVVQGISKDSCVLQAASQPIQPWTVGGGATKVTDMTLAVTTPGATIVELRNGYYDLFENCAFRDGIVQLVGANLAGFPQFEFEKCVFTYNGGNVINATGSTGLNVKIVLKNCIVKESSLGISWTITKTGGWMNILQLKNTDMTWGRINVTGTVSLLVEGGSHYNEGGNANIMSATTAVVSIAKASYGNAGGNIVRFTANPSSFNFSGNLISGSGTYDLYATVAVTTATVVGNVMVNGMHGNVQTISPIKYVGGGVDFYKTIQDAVTACSAGQTVGIYAGSYSEQITITDKSLTLQGIGGQASLSASTNPVLDLNKTGTSNVIITLKNIDVSDSFAGNATIDMDNSNATRWLRVLAYDGTFYTSANARANSMDGAGACSFFTKNCLLMGEGEDHWHIESTANTNSYLYITQSSHDGARYRLSQGRLEFDTATAVNEIVVEAGNTNTRVWKWISTFLVSPITIAATGMGIQASFCTFSRTGENITLTAANDNLDFKNCAFLSGGSAFNISATVDVDMVVLECPMDTGMEGTVQTTNAEKEVGPGVNSYKDVKEALASIKTDNCRVILNEDQTITAALAPPSYEVMIDGNHQFQISRGAGLPLMTVGAGDDVKFVSVDLVGSIDVNGNGAKLHLADHTFLTGMVDVQGGDSSTEVRIDQAKVVGDATDGYAIRIADADPTIIVKRSYLKGDSSAAVYWDTVTNDNLKVAWGTLMHGSLSTNNPFGRSGSQTPDYCSHHSMYNADPGGGGIWTNLIGTPYDSFDVDGDY